MFVIYMYGRGTFGKLRLLGSASFWLRSVAGGDVHAICQSGYGCILNHVIFPVCLCRP